MKAKVGTQAGKDVEANSLGRRRGVWAFSAAGVGGLRLLHRTAGLLLGCPTP